VYIPDTREFAIDVIEYLRDAFFLAFADDITMIDRIILCKEDNDFVILSNDLAYNGTMVYYIIDQVNALDYESGGNNTSRTKDRIQDVISRLGYRHMVVKSNHRIAQELQVSQEAVAKMYYNSGLD
jgi:hypothetical protein